MVAAGLGRRDNRKALEQMDPRKQAGAIGATFGVFAAFPVVLIWAFVADAYGWNSDWIDLPMAAVAIAGAIGGAAWRKRRLRHHPTAATMGRGERIGLRAYFFALIFCLQAWCLCLLLRD